MELKGRVCVITGGSGGIGRAIASTFLREGARAVVLADPHQDRVRAAAHEIGCEGTACDVTSEQDVQHLVYETLKTRAYRPLLFQRRSRYPWCID